MTKAPSIFILPTLTIVLTLSFFSGCHKKQRATLKTCQSHSLTKLQTERLGQLLSELTRAPFGTGASLAIDNNGQMATLVEGTTRNEGELINASTLFNIASVSKTLTAARMVALAREQKISLDDSVSKYLPGVLLLNGARVDVTDSITIRDLLRHLSGLPHQPGSQLNPRTFENKWTIPDLLTILTRDWTLTLTGEPGKYQYSNMGYVLLGAIIESIDGCPFGTSMESYLSGIGLKRFSYKPVSGGSNMACGKIVKDNKVTFNVPGWYGSTYALPFSGAWISMADLARFGEQLSKIDEMTSLKGHSSSSTKGHIRSSTKGHSRSSTKGDSGYGLGIIHNTFSGEKTLEHDGSGPGFLARLIILPELNIVLAVACNGGDESGALGKRFKKITDDMMSTILSGIK